MNTIEIYIDTCEEIRASISVLRARHPWWIQIRQHIQIEIYAWVVSAEDRHGQMMKYYDGR